MPVDQAADVDEVVEGGSVPGGLNLRAIGGGEGETLRGGRERVNRVERLGGGDSSAGSPGGVAQLLASRTVKVRYPTSEPEPRRVWKRERLLQGRHSSCS